MIVLENGTLAESGTFNELKSAGGVFSNISANMAGDEGRTGIQ